MFKASRVFPMHSKQKNFNTQLSETGKKVDARVALLTNFIPPYKLSLYSGVASRVKHLKIFISTVMESNRAWPVNWGKLDVERQRSWAVEKMRREHGFEERTFLHFPYNTFSELRKFRPDIILTSELGFRTLMVYAFTRFFRSVTYIPILEISEHTEQMAGTTRQWLRKILLRGAGAVLANGSSCLRYVANLIGKNDKVFVVPMGVDFESFHPGRISTNADRWNRFLYVGRLVSLKGLLPFLSALSEWMILHPSEKKEFWLVGDGPQAVDIKNFKAPPNLTIQLLGNVEYERLPEIYAQCGIFVFPSLSDSWGMAVVEALSSGLPVLGSRYSQAVEDVVREGESGWIFRTDNTEEMNSAIARALGSPIHVLEQMRAQSIQAASSYRTELIVNATVDVLASAYQKRTDEH